MKFIKISGQTKGGYAVLVSTMLISFVLSAVIFSISQESFLGRQGTLNRELKEISFNLAEGCIQKAILIIVQSPNFEITPENKTLFSGSLGDSMKPNLDCSLKLFEREENISTIIVQAKAGEAVTNLEADFDETNLKIKSLKELGSF